MSLGAANIATHIGAQSIAQAAAGGTTFAQQLSALRAFVAASLSARVPAAWLATARRLAATPQLSYYLIYSLACTAMWAMRWRAQLAQQRRAALSPQPMAAQPVCSPAGAGLLLESPAGTLLLVVSPSAEQRAPEDLLVALDNVRAVDLYDDDCDVHVHGSPAPQLAAVMAAVEQQAAAEEEAESLLTPNTANLINRLQQPRRFKASSWQPSSRSDATGAEDAQAVVAQQVEQQRSAAEDAAQKRAAKRAKSTASTSSGALGSRSRALLESRQPCEVYSASSKRWLAGSVIAFNEVLPNTVKVEYKVRARELPPRLDCQGRL